MTVRFAVFVLAAGARPPAGSLVVQFVIVVTVGKSELGSSRSCSCWRPVLGFGLNVGRTIRHCRHSRQIRAGFVSQPSRRRPALIRRRLAHVLLTLKASCMYPIRFGRTRRLSINENENIAHVIQCAMFAIGSQGSRLFCRCFYRHDRRDSLSVCVILIRIPSVCQAAAGRDDCRRSGIAVGQGGDRCRPGFRFK